VLVNVTGDEMALLIEMVVDLGVNCDVLHPLSVCAGHCERLGDRGARDRHPLASPLEQYWLGEMRRLFEPFTSRVTLIYFNQLSFEDMLNRAQVLPEHSAISFGLTGRPPSGGPG
jgi:hypothetical protein